MSSEIKVSSVKAKDGTAGISIADSTGNVSLSGSLSAGTIGGNVTKKVRAFSAYASVAGSIADSTWSNFGAVGTWTERYDTHGDYNNSTGVFQNS